MQKQDYMHVWSLYEPSYGGKIKNVYPFFEANDINTSFCMQQLKSFRKHPPTIGVRGILLGEISFDWNWGKWILGKIVESCVLLIWCYVEDFFMTKIFRTRFSQTLTFTNNKKCRSRWMFFFLWLPAYKSEHLFFDNLDQIWREAYIYFSLYYLVDLKIFIISRNDEKNWQS